MQPETRGVIISLIEREPGHGLAVLSHPFAQKRGLPKTRGRRDESQLASQAFIHPLGQAGTENNFSPRRRDVKFGG